MTKVGAQGIKLTDKLNGTRGNKRNIHIVNNGQREDFTWFDVNQLSDKYAWILHKHARMAKTAAIIGMYSKQVRTSLSLLKDINIYFIRFNNLLL